MEIDFKALTSWKLNKALVLPNSQYLFGQLPVQTSFNASATQRLPLPLVCKISDN
jgi:hypothetical protein